MSISRLSESGRASRLLPHSLAVLMVLLSALRAPLQPQATAAEERIHLDSAAVERLFGLARVWSTVSFFHPWVAYRDVRWDDAAQRAIGPAISAVNPQDYATVLAEMLDALGDPVTRVVPLDPRDGLDVKATRPTPPGPQPRLRVTADSVLMVLVEDYDGLTDWTSVVGQLRLIPGMLEGSRGVVFDLRAGRPVQSSAAGAFAFAFSSSGVATFLLSEAVPTLPMRERVHHGFAPEFGATSGGYHSAFQTRDRTWIPARADAPFPTVFLVDQYSVVPAEAVAMQAAGAAAIVREGSVSPRGPAATHMISLPQGIRVEIRLSESPQPDGSVGIPVDLEVDPAPIDGAERDPSLEAAQELALDFRLEPRTVAPGPHPEGLAPVHAWPNDPYPSLALRVMAAFRIWAVVDLFFPYGGLMDRDWSSVLREYLPRFAAATDAESYHLAVAEMYAHTQDTHGVVRSAVLDGLLGVAPPPVYARWIEGEPVIAGFRDEGAARAAGARIGDVILEVDGEDAVTRIQRYKPLIAASTPGALTARAVDWMLHGPDGSTARLTLVGSDGQPRSVHLPRQSAYRRFSWRSGDVVRILEGNIGYVDLDRLTAPDVAPMFARLKSTRAIIFDMRGYPNGTAWAVAPYLATQPQVAAAIFDRPLLTGPGEAGRQRYTFVQRIPPPSGPERYRGRTVMLVDDRTISQAEHTGLFLEAANGSEFIGTPSNGANGDVTNFGVPGGIVLSFTGQSVRHADGRQLQRVGLQPTVTAEPTTAGLRAGKDEVLEAALQRVRDPGPEG